jgi:hypothetical protein
MKTKDLKEFIEDTKLKPEIAMQVVFAHAKRLEFLVDIARCALKPFAKAYNDSRSTTDKEEITKGIIVSNYQTAAEAMCHLGYEIGSPLPRPQSQPQTQQPND